MGCGASLEAQELKRLALERKWFDAVAADDRGVVRKIHHFPENLVDPEDGGSARIVPVDSVNPNSFPLVDNESTKLWTALMIAAAMGHVRIVVELLDQKCDTNIRRPGAGSALAHAAERCRRRGGTEEYEAIVNKLLEAQGLLAPTLATLVEAGAIGRHPNSREVSDRIWNEARRRGYDPRDQPAPPPALEGGARAAEPVEEALAGNEGQPRTAPRHVRLEEAHINMYVTWLQEDCLAAESFASERIPVGVPTPPAPPDPPMSVTVAIVE